MRRKKNVYEIWKSVVHRRPLRPYAMVYFTKGSIIAVCVLGVVLFAYYFLLRPPYAFPVGSSVTISEGQTASEIAELLYEKKIVQSPLLFRIALIAARADGSAKAGSYFFGEPVHLIEAARMIAVGDYGLDPVRVTIPEGSSVFNMAVILASHLPSFDATAFVEQALPKEGYLFPETYFFTARTQPEEIIARMERTFYDKIAPYESMIAASGKTLNEIITMASLIEREARTSEVRKTISGVLWRRIELGMPLQVDAAFSYVNGKNSYTLTRADLQIDSPYNTYVNKGLPPGPIASPSIDAIEAALAPTPTPYLYFLSDHSGVTHFSETFDEHRTKKAIYLN